MFKEMSVFLQKMSNYTIGLGSFWENESSAYKLVNN